MKTRKKKPFDFLIVGSGLYGSVIARELFNAGKRCFILEKRDHPGGNVYTENIAGIDVHRYGAHILHTDNKKVWEYVNQIAEFNRFTNSPLANYKGQIFHLPFNMNTFHAMWGVVRPQDARDIIVQQRASEYCDNPKNLTEQAVNLVGWDIFEKLIRGYTEKQWGRKCEELPPDIITRLPVRFTWDNNYFNSRYQGIPIKGYTNLIGKMLKNSEVRLSCDFFENRHYWESLAEQIIYTGPIDAYFDYVLGPLEYRSVRFETHVLNIPDFQGVAVMNFTDRETPWTRIIEHKHFNFGFQKNTVLSYEYSDEWNHGKEPFYPINDKKNTALYRQYKDLADKLDNVHFCGRLGEYCYYDMDKTIESALKKSSELLHSEPFKFNSLEKSSIPPYPVFEEQVE